MKGYGWLAVFALVGVFLLFASHNPYPETVEQWSTRHAASVRVPPGLSCADVENVFARATKDYYKACLVHVTRDGHVIIKQPPTGVDDFTRYYAENLRTNIMAANVSGPLTFIVTSRAFIEENNEHVYFEGAPLFGSCSRGAGILIPRP